MHLHCTTLLQAEIPPNCRIHFTPTIQLCVLSCIVEKCLANLIRFVSGWLPGLVNSTLGAHEQLNN